MRPLPYIHILALSLVCLSLGELRGQVPDRTSYMKCVEGQSLLYRGKIEKQYSFKYKGTYFAYQEEYVEGEVWYNQKLYTGVLLNLNSYTDELSVRYSGSHLPVLLDKSLVKSFKLGQKPFIQMMDGEVDGIDPGYYEVLTDGDMKLMKRIVKEYREELVASGQDSRIERVFDAATNYYLVNGQEWVRITGTGTFVKMFPERRRELKAIFRGATRAQRGDKDNLYRRMMEVVL